MNDWRNISFPPVLPHFPGITDPIISIRSSFRNFFVGIFFDIPIVDAAFN